MAAFGEDIFLIFYDQIINEKGKGNADQATVKMSGANEKFAIVKTIKIFKRF